MVFKRVNGKLVNEKKLGQVVMREGHRMAVTRPVSKEAAETAVVKAEALVAAEFSDQESFNRIWYEQVTGDGVLFMGLLGHGGRILDPRTLEDIGEIQRGDSFVSFEDLQKLSLDAAEQPS